MRAQSRGTITDATGAVIVNAKVVLVNDDTGFMSSTMSASDGAYSFAPVKIGRYTVSVEFSGFKKGTTHVVVDVQQQVRADFQLVTGAITEVVEVSAAPPQLQTQDASVGTVATREQIEDLPLISRNYTFLAQLGSGVTTLNPSRGLDGPAVSWPTACRQYTTITSLMGSTTTTIPLISSMARHT